MDYEMVDGMLEQHHWAGVVPYLFWCLVLVREQSTAVSVVDGEEDQVARLLYVATMYCCCSIPGIIIQQHSVLIVHIISYTLSATRDMRAGCWAS